MNIEQLMLILADKDPKLPVLLSTDEEGNGFNNLEGVSLSDGDIKALVLWPDSAFADFNEVFST